MRIFVTDGENRAALAVTRSLGAAGHTVLVGERFSPALAQASRHCARAIVYPDPVHESARFIDFLAEVVKRERVDAILPVADITTFLISRHRARFEPDARVPFAPIEVLERAADKVDVMMTAQRIGVPIPTTVVVHAASAVPEFDLGFPVVIKPHQSRILTDDGWKPSSVSYASSRDEVLRDLAARPAHEFPVMLQRRVQGPGIGVFACYDRGRPIALFSHRRLRERPPWGGVSVLCESAPLDPVARDCATRLLEEIGWSGVAMVEFKRDVADGLPKLMEINGRFWGSLQLAVDAGVDFPRLLVETLGGRPPASPADYRVGVRSRWWWGDFDSLLFHLLRRDRWPSVPPISRFEAVRQFLRVFDTDLRYENPRWDDLGPWWYETRQRLAPARVRRAHAADAAPRAAAPPVRPRPSAPRETAPLLDASTRVVAQLSDIPACEWNTLSRQSDTHAVFQTHEWADAFVRTCGSPGSTLILEVRERQALRGIAALTRHTIRGRRVLRFLSDQRADYCDVLAGHDPEPVIERMFEALRADSDWDYVDLVNIPSMSRTPTILHRLARRAGYHVLLREQSVCPTLIVRGREAEAREVLEKKNLRRRVNYFRRNGGLTCRHLTSRAAIEPYLELFFAQHVARWAGTGSPSLFEQPHNRAFYRALAEAADSTGWVMFTVAETSDGPIAMHFGFDYDDVVMWYKPTFDLSVAKHSPGLVLVHELLNYTVEHDRRELDFTLGAEAFKARFANHVRQTVRLQIFRRRLDYALTRGRRHAADAARRVTPR